MSKPRRGFTLVELLVVIGIIALLISILMPSLSGAQRKSKSVKCMASLRQIGLAFAMYGQDFKGAWPVAVHQSGQSAGKPWLMPGTGERRWPDLIGPYVVGKKDMAYNEIDKVRQMSVLWGCPEWTSSNDRDALNSSTTNDILRPGYGMQYYPNYPDNVPSPVDGWLAYYSTTAPGSYWKSTRWGTHGSQRGLIADSITHIIQTPTTCSRSGVTFQPFTITGQFYVDGTRHAKLGTTAQQARTGIKGMNMLFCDGHVDSVTVVEAWNAIHNPGEDRSTP